MAAAIVVLKPGVSFTTLLVVAAWEASAAATSPLRRPISMPFTADTANYCIPGLRTRIRALRARSADLRRRSMELLGSFGRCLGESAPVLGRSPPAVTGR